MPAWRDLGQTGLVAVSGADAATGSGAPPVRVTGRAVGALVLATLGGFDAWVVGLSWPLAVFVLVAGLAVAGSLTGAVARRVLAAAAVLVSGAATAGMALRPPAAAGSFGLVEAASLLLLLLSCVQAADTLPDRLLCVASVLALVALPLRVWSGDTLIWVLLVVVVVAVTLAVAVTLRSQDRQRRTAVVLARRSEREAVARELHDLVAHHVTGIVVATQAARSVGADDPAAVTATLASIETAGGEAMAAMRRLVGVLRADEDAVRRPAAGLTDLPDLVRRFDEAGGHSTDLVLPGPVSLAPEVQAAVFRIVQESLTNIRRHGPASPRVRVSVTVADRTTVEVTSSASKTGKARTPPAGGGFGIVGMQERVAALGGTLTACPHGSGEWLVRAVLPGQGSGVRR